jgi:periplasmic protein TonB
MHEPFLRSFSGNKSASESWLNRVRDNLGQLLIPSHLKPSSANGAPIHLLKFDKSLQPARAQGASLLTHAAVFTAVLLLLTQGTARHPVPRGDGSTPLAPPTITQSILRSLASAEPSAGSGKGGGQSPLPATRGNLPPLSSIVLVRPTIPQDTNPHLPEPPTIFDANSPPVLTPTENMGLPWMPKDTNSAGPGKGVGIGSLDDNGVGDRGNGPGGYGGQNSPYSPAAVQPACAYCPYPTYTDEARHGKVQGAVTLAVLVGADGRAHDVRVVKGIGFGLDERAVETVRGWKFVPARDSAKRAVPAWVTVETVFRLF